MRLYIQMLVGLAFILMSCSEEVSKSFQNKPQAFGKTNHVAVICDDVPWEGALGDTVTYYYGAAFPVTPSPEPIYEIKHYTPEQLKKVSGLRRKRTYLVLANLNDLNSSTTKMLRADIGEEKFRQAREEGTINSIVGKDKWAKGQIVIYLFANSESKLIDVVKNKFPDVSSRIYDHDYKQLKANTYAGGLNNILINDIKKLYRLDMKVPSHFQTAKLDPDKRSYWIRKDDAKSIQNIVFMKMPYKSEKQFSLDTIFKHIETFGATNIQDDKLLINDSDLPTYEFNRSKPGLYIKEIRGIWEAERKFQGGPYQAHVIYPEGGDEIIIIFAFLYAPGEDKRDIMQQLEIILNSVTRLPNS